MRKSLALLLLSSLALHADAQILCVDCADQVAPISAGGVNLISNGSFETTTCNTWPGFWDVYCPNASTYVCDIQDWVCSGGGVSTYTLIFDAATTTVPDGLLAAYMGNNFVESCSAVVDDTSCWVMVDCTVTGIPPGFPVNDVAYGGAAGVSLSQTVTGLTVGAVYTLGFWAGGENFPLPGVFGVDVGFGYTYLRCDPSPPGTPGTRYEITFQAISTTHTVIFTNWGHACSSCSEVVLDDVVLKASSAVGVTPAFNLNVLGGGVGGVGAGACDLTVEGINQSIGAASFLWDMGDGTTYTTTDVTHTYALPGTYDVTLYTIGGSCIPGDSLTQTVTLVLPDTVSASFSFATQFDCTDLIVDCTNISVGTAPTYLWDMGDGTTYTTEDVIDHQYAAPGTYTITLVASDTSSCNVSDTASATFSIALPLPVSASFTLAQVFDCAQLIVDAANTSSGDHQAFAWDMGDGTLYNDTNVSHTYTAAGTYDVMLVVSDTSGCSPNDTAIVSVTLDPIVPVVSAFTIDQVGDCTLLTANGTNQSTGDSVAYVWDMGDGTLYTSTDVTHAYAAPGTYTVELLVLDLGCGDDDSISTTVTVIDSLAVTIVTDGVICPDLTTTLYATGNSGAGYSFLWNDGTPTDSLVVGAAGSYWVVVGTAFCTGTDTAQVIAAVDQELSYEVDACPNAPITLTIPFDGTAYVWEVGGTGQSVNFLFPGVDTTSYGFQVWDTLGCVHADSVTVRPLDSEPQLFVPNAFTPDGDGVNDEFVITGFGERDVELLIFDRWGQQIYGTSSLQNPWNGTYNGQIKQDVYVYKLTYNGECSNDETRLIGHVTLVR